MIVDEPLPTVETTKKPHFLYAARRHLISALLIAVVSMLTYLYLPDYLARGALRAQVDNVSAEWYDELLEIGILKPSQFAQTDRVGGALSERERSQLANLARVNGQYRVSLYDIEGNMFFSTSRNAEELPTPDFDLTDPDKIFSSNISVFDVPYGEIEDIETGTHRATVDDAKPVNVAEVVIPYSRDGNHYGFVILDYNIDSTYLWYKRNFQLGLLVITGFFIVGILLLGFAQYTLDVRIYRNQVDVLSRNVQMRKFEKRQTRQIQLMSEMVEWLQTATSIGEFFQILEKFMNHVFPHRLGTIYLYDDERRHLLRYSSWNFERDKLSARIHPHDCWSLRRGRFYEYGRNLVEFKCNHTAPYQTDHYACIPINANGETIGTIHIANPEGVEFDATQADEDLAALTQITEQFSVALANLSLKSKLLEQTVRDPLTNLYNRRGFYQQVEKFSMRPDSFTKKIVAMIDVDHFKQFNDQFGHDAGDTVLRAIGALLRGLKSVSSFRMGGEEFAVIFDQSTDTDALDVLNNIRGLVSKLNLKANGQNLPRITASIGYSLWHDQAHNIDDILKEADQALYDAKEAGRNVVKCFEQPEMDKTMSTDKPAVILEGSAEATKVINKAAVKSVNKNTIAQNGAAQNKIIKEKQNDKKDTAK